jgi:hypothetical protein
MAVLTRAQIPPGINSLERLTLWCCFCYQYLCAGKQVKTLENSPLEQQCQVSQVVLADGKQYFQVVGYFPITVTDLYDGSKKPWIAAEDVANTSLHANLIVD